MKTQLTRLALLASLAVVLFMSSCKTYDVASRYSSKYVKANSGKLNAQVPEAVELGYTMLALTDLAQKDTSIVNQHTAYYQELMAWFAQYKNVKGVKQLNADLARNPKMIKSYLNGLYAFKIKEGRFGLKDSYRIDLNKVDFKRYALLLQNFYKETRFHDFYAQHSGLYNNMIQEANTQLNFEKAQSSFNDKVNGYQVILSPLANSFTGNMHIKGHAYSEYIMFVRVAAHNAGYAMAANNSTAVQTASK